MALLSASALLFQVAQTRLFSAILGYHLTFVAVSIALLGVGAGGTAAALLDRRRRRPSSAGLAILASITYVLALVVSTSLDPIAVDSSVAVILTYLVSSIPYTLVSWVVVRTLTAHPTQAGRIYASDLLGAAAGGIVAFAAMSSLGAPGEYGLAAGFAACASVVLADGRWARSTASLVVVTTVAATIALGSFADQLLPIRTAAYKPIIEDLRRGATLETGRWDPQGRIDVVRYGAEGASDVYDFLIDRSFSGPRPDALVMRIDFDAATLIMQGGAKADTSVLGSSVLAAPYHLVDGPDVLVIGPGGGIDVLTALEGNARAVTGVDLNRTLISTVEDTYRGYGGALYEDPRVSIVGDEARSFVRRSSQRYGVIVMTVVDSWAALQSGAYALSESYLYTAQAFADYLRHLEPDGVLSIGRWYRDTPTEMVRAMEVAGAGLRLVGADRPQRHIAVIRSAAFGLMLVRASEFDDASMQTIRDFAGSHGFEVAYDPLRGVGPLAAMYTAGSGRDPATDDRPFFFDAVPLTETLTGRAPLTLGHETLLAALLTAVVLSIAVILLPLRRRIARADGHLTRWVTSTASLLGFGFIVVEIVLLQRLTLYLGQPTLALTVGVAGLLSGAAAGSASIRRLGGGVRGAALGSVVVLGAVLAVFPMLADATLAAPLAMRISLSVACAVAVGTPLGTVFPRVLQAARSEDESLLAWAWGVNGAASVIGSILAAGLVLETGFSALAWVAIACYGVLALIGEPGRTGEPVHAATVLDGGRAARLGSPGQ